MNSIKVRNIIDRLLAAAFCLLAAGVTFSNAVTEISSISIVVLWAVKKILTKDWSLPGGFLALILITFLGWNILSFYNTDYLYDSFRGLLKVFKYVFLFMAAIDYFDSRVRIKRYLLYMAGICFFIALDGIIQYTAGADIIRHRVIDPLDHLHRVSASFVHSNDLGAYLVVMLAVILSLFFSSKRAFKQRLLIFLVILPVAWSLLKTQSRGAWLSFVIAAIFLFSLKSKKILVLMLLLLLASPLILPDSVKERFSDIAAYNTAGTTWERVKLWQGSIDMVKVHPVLGFGVNTYTKNFTDYASEDYPEVKYTHNSYLHMATEIGVIGTAIFIIFLLSLIVSAAEVRTKLQRGIYRDLYLGLLAGSTGFLCHCFVDTHLYSVTLAAFIFLCLGLIVALRKVIYEDAS